MSLPEQLVLAVVFSPLALIGLLLLRRGIQNRHLGRPLFRSHRVVGTIVEHRPRLLTNRQVRTSVVITFFSEWGSWETYIEPPLRFGTAPVVGSEVRVSHKFGDPKHVKRFGRRRHLIGWIQILLSLPLLAWMTLIGQFVFGAVALFLVGLVLHRAIRQGQGVGAALAHHPVADSNTAPAPPKPPVHPTQPSPPTVPTEFLPSMGESGDEGPRTNPDLRTWIGMRSELLRDCAIGVLVIGPPSIAVGQILDATLFSLVAHLFLLAGIGIFESTLPYPDGEFAVGTVSRFKRVSGPEGVVIRQFVSFQHQNDEIEFMPAQFGPSAAVGSQVRVSFRPHAPEQARQVGKGESRRFAAVFLAVGIFIGFYGVQIASFPLLGATLLAYFIVRRRWARRLRRVDPVLDHASDPSTAPLR